MLVAGFGIPFSALCGWLVFTTYPPRPPYEILATRAFFIVLSIFSLSAAAYSIYFFFHPVTWQVQVSAQSIRWQSPHLPRQSREIPLSEIVAARASGGDVSVLELHLASGEIITLPSPCVGRYPERILNALTAANPQIRALT